MSEKPESDEFEDDAELPSADAEDSDYEFMLEDLRPKRNAVPQGEPAWRKLEKYREQKATAELISDFDDYDIGDEEGGKKRRKPRQVF